VSVFVLYTMSLTKKQGTLNIEQL